MAALLGEDYDASVPKAGTPILDVMPGDATDADNSKVPAMDASISKAAGMQ
jgi:hypothetical protein